MPSDEGGGREEPVWLPLEELEAINRRQLVFGEKFKVWFPNELASALARPHFYWSNGEDDVIVLASMLCCGIARQQCFEAANKRTALAAAHSFLGANGYRLHDDGTLGLQVEQFAEKKITEDQFTQILRRFIVPE